MNEKDHAAVLAIGAQIYLHRLPLAQFNWPSARLLEELQQAETLVWVDERAAVGGFLCYRSIGDGFDITVLGTSESFSRQGVQTEIIQQLQALAAAQNKSILLEVHEGNQVAHRFYSKCGFHKLSVRPQYYTDGAAADVLIWRSDKAGC